MKFVIDTGRDRLEFPLLEGTATIGRDATCDVQLDHPKVSRRHVECVAQGGELTIRDLSSKNGTYVNDAQIQEVKLNHGDVIKVGGEVQLLFDQGDMSNAATIIVPGDQPPIQHQPQRPPGTVDADEEPTPADNNLLPAQVVAGTQQADARIINRDGKLYAQDPATGQEVEITPVHAERQAAPPKRTLLQRFASLRPITKVSFVLCALLIGSGVVFRLSKGKPKKRERPTMSRSQYAQLMEDAWERLDANDVQGAEQLLKRAHKALPKRKMASMLYDLCRIWVDLHTSFLETNESAEELLDEISESEFASHKVKLCATKKLNWIHTENQNQGIIYNADKYVRAKKWEEAFKLFEQLPKDSLFYPLVQERMSDAHDQIVEASLAEAKRAFEDQKWEPAAKAYEKVKRYDSEIPDLATKIQTCRRNASDHDRLRKARKAKSDGDWEQVTAHADMIKPDGPYGPAAAELKKLVEGKAVLVEAKRLYNQGNADQALVKLQGLRTPDAMGLVKHIEDVVRQFEEGNKKAAAEQFAQAQTYWGTVLRLENDEGNFYRRQAAQNIANWRAQAGNLAYDLVEKGTDEYRKKNYVQARKLFEEAKRKDPDGKAGQGQIDVMLKEARRFYNQALNKRAKDPKTAHGLFTRVKQMTLPAEPLHQQATQQIDMLTAEDP